MCASRPHDLRPRNAEAVLRSVLDRPGLSRADVARQLQMSQPTVLDIVDRFVADGVLQEIGTIASGGRPGVALDVAPEAARVIGIDLGGTYLRSALFGLDAQLVQHARVETDRTSRDAVLQQIVALVRDLRANDQAAGRAFHCLVVGAPGYVRDGTVIDAANLPEWTNIPLREYLEHELGMPVMVENDVDLAALGEVHYGAGRDFANVVCVAIGTGFGAGLIVEKTLVRGADGAAGETAFIVPGTEFLDQSFGGKGALETMAAMPALPTHAPAGSRFRTASPAQIITAARQGDADANATVQAWTRYVAIALIALSAICNPELIVVGGGGGVRIYDLIEASLIQYLTRHVPLPPRLAPAQLGDEAALWGALVLGKGTAITQLAAKPTNRP